MLCSKCSEVVKPVVAIDIDGTMGDYHAHFLAFATDYFGEPSTDWWGYSGHGKFSEWFMQAFDCDYRTWHDVKLAYRQGGMKRSMPPFASIIQFAREAALYRKCEIWVTTTRPFLRMDNIDPDTREWLRRNNVHYSGLIYDDDKYEALAERIDSNRVVAVYDDLPEMYDSAEDVFGDDVPFLVSTRWNRNVTKPNMGGAQLAWHHLVNNLNKWGSAREESAA